MIDIATDPGVEHLLRIARAQCDASLAFAAIRDDAGKITVVTYPPTDDGTYWTLEGLRGIAQNTWDDPLLGRGGRAVLRISMPPKRLIPVPRQHSRLAVATLGSVVYPDLPWGLLCALEPVSGQFTDEHLDVLGNLAVRLNNYLRARQSVVEANGDATEPPPAPTAQPGRGRATETTQKRTSRSKQGSATTAREVTPPAEEAKPAGRRGKAAAAAAEAAAASVAEDKTGDPGEEADVATAGDVDEIEEVDVTDEDAELAAEDEVGGDDEEGFESREQEKDVIVNNEASKSRKGSDVIVEIQRDSVLEEVRAPVKASSSKSGASANDSLVLVGLNEFLARVEDAIVELRHASEVGAVVLLNIAGAINPIGELEAASVSSRLMAHTRYDDAVARVGSGTFGILLKLRRGVSDPATIRLRLEDWARQSLPAGPTGHNVRSCLVLVDPNEQPRPEDLFLRAVSQLGVL